MDRNARGSPFIASLAQKPQVHLLTLVDNHRVLSDDCLFGKPHKGTPSRIDLQVKRVDAEEAPRRASKMNRLVDKGAFGALHAALDRPIQN